MAKDINNLVLGGYKIKTGLNSYDQGCGPENCKAIMTDEDVAKSCATILTRVNSESNGGYKERYCVSIGGNVGELYEHPAKSIYLLNLFSYLFTITK